MTATVSSNSLSYNKEVHSVLNRVRDEVAEGQTEYTWLLTAIPLVLPLMPLHFGGWLSDTYQWIINHLPL